MWEHRGQDIWWRPGVLTAQNRQDSTAPQLTLVEAESVFRVLEDDKLIFPVKHPDGGSAYLINEVKKKEWTKFLRSISWFHVFILRPLVRIFGSAWAVFVWLLSVIIASVIGAFLQQSIAKLLQK